MGQAAQEAVEIPHGRMGTHRVMKTQEIAGLEGTGQGVKVIAEPGTEYQFTTVDYQGDGREHTYKGKLQPGEFLVERHHISGQQPS